MDFDFQEFIRQLIVAELDKRQERNDLVPLQQFCSEKKLNRSTIWRAEREGRVKLYRFGKRIFINPTEFLNSIKKHEELCHRE